MNNKSKLLDYKNVHTVKEVFVLEFQEENVDGYKFTVRCLQTSYMSFFASPFENYYRNYDDAAKVAFSFNNKG